MSGQVCLLKMLLIFLCKLTLQSVKSNSVSALRALGIEMGMCGDAWPKRWALISYWEERTPPLGQLMPQALKETPYSFKPPHTLSHWLVTHSFDPSQLLACSVSHVLYGAAWFPISYRQFKIQYCVGYWTMCFHKLCHHTGVIYNAAAAWNTEPYRSELLCICFL